LSATPLRCKLPAALKDAARDLRDSHPRSVKRAALECIKTTPTRITELPDSAAQGLLIKPFGR